MNSNDGAKGASPDKKLKATTSIRSKQLMFDDHKRGFKWSFSRDDRLNKSKDFRQKHSPQTRVHPYKSSLLNEDQDKKPTQTKPIFLPPKEMKNPKTIRETDELTRVAEYKTKNPGPSTEQIMQLERQGIESRKNRSVDVSRGLLSLKRATTADQHEDMKPRDADDDQYHKRVADKSKFQRKNYSAAFMKAFFDEANAIASRGGPNKTIDKRGNIKYRTMKNKTLTSSDSRHNATLIGSDVEKFVASGQEKIDH